MRILKLHHPTGSPYWNRDEYKVELPDGTFYDIGKHSPGFGGGYRILIKDSGLYYQQCYSGSGFGKKDATDRFPPVLIVPREKYDSIKFVGEPLVISEELKSDLNKYGLK